MRLQLVPIDGERTLSEDEKQRQKRRTRPIPTETINYFTADQQTEIKKFLANLIIVAEQCHHDIYQLNDISDDDRLVYIEEELNRLNEHRIHLFDNLPYFLKYFCKLLDLCPSEPWKELEQFLKNVAKENTDHQHQTSQSLGIEAAMENTYLLQIEEDLDEEISEAQIKCRITPAEIEELIIYHPLETLINHLINARRVSSGEFWDKDFHDL